MGDLKADKPEFNEYKEWDDARFNTNLELQSVQSVIARFDLQKYFTCDTCRTPGDRRVAKGCCEVCSGWLKAVNNCPNFSESLTKLGQWIDDKHAVQQLEASDNAPLMTGQSQIFTALEDEGRGRQLSQPSARA